MAAATDSPVRRHAREQAAVLLRRFAFQVARTSRLAHTEAVHDLRVSIRRLARCLRVFGEFYPSRGAKKVRRKLKGLMRLAAEVRNRDVALEFLRGAGLAGDVAVVRALTADRDAAEHALRTALRDWTRRHSVRKWRAHLEL